MDLPRDLTADASMHGLSPTDDLDKLLTTSFGLFSRGVADRRSAFRTPCVATVAPDGTPHLRTMVLRAFDRGERRLMLHTDRRAAKLADIAHAPRVAVHVYDTKAAIQIRLAAEAQLHIDDDVARAAWERGLTASRACYAIEPGPGTRVDAPPVAARFDEAAYAHFAVMAVRFHTLEFLWLHHGGHRRARFDWSADGTLEASWLVP